MENFNEVNLSRRNFVKGALAAGGAVALAAATPAVKPFEAFAATTLADGTYKVNANLYISKSIVLIKKNAYFTNPADPQANGGTELPENPATELNAEMEIAGGVATVTVPLVNECFMLLEAASGSTAEIVSGSVFTSKAIYKDTDGSDLNRISSITFKLANTSGSYTLGTCKEYAAWESAPFPMSMLVPGYLNWTATLAVDFSTAQIVSA